MSHFTVMVIGKEPEKQLQPYHEYECTGIKDEYVKFVEAGETREELRAEYEEVKEEYSYKSFEEFLRDYYGYQEKDGKVGRYTNPNAKWDWYQLGGRWNGFFKLKSNRTGKAGSPGIMRSPAKRGYADQCLKGDIDIEGMYMETYDEAFEHYGKVLEVFGGEIPKLDYFWEDLIQGENVNYDEAREKYHNQPAMLQFKELKIKYKDDKEKDFLMWLDFADYQCTQIEYAERAARTTFQTFAFIKDGKWYEQGEMGWWGCVSNEKDPDEWNKQFMDMFKALPDDTLISIMDCHI